MGESKFFEVVAENWAYGGEVIGRLPDGRAVFIPFAAPGEKVSIELVEEKRGFTRARLLEVLEPSPDRIEPRCRHFTVCGGCQRVALTRSTTGDAVDAMPASRRICSRRF